MRCRYCLLEYNSEKAALNHEIICLFNPEIRACFTCKFFYEANHNCTCGVPLGEHSIRRKCSLWEGGECVVK
jgi:hypothetical protein